MDIRDLKIYIYESCDCGYIDDISCKKMITACESVSNNIGSGLISTLQASIESLKELILEPKDYKINKDIVINLEKSTTLYSCSNAIETCIGNRNMDRISSNLVMRLVTEYKDADHHTWRDNVHEKIDEKIISKLNKELEDRHKAYEKVMKNYKEEVDIYSVKYKDFSNKYTSFCNEDIRFYNDYINEAIDNLEYCKELLQKANTYNLPSYTGIIQSYVSCVVKLNMRTVQHCHSIMKKTLDYNKKKYESM